MATGLGENRLATRRSQLERDIARSVDRLIAEFVDDTAECPHAVDVELSPTTAREGGRRYVVVEVRAHIDRPE